MFEVRCLVGDKSLHKVLHVLNGMTLEPPVVLSTTVENETGNVLVGKRGDKNTQELIRDYITEKGLTKIKPKEMKQICSDAGFSGNAYSHALNSLLDAGLLKKSKSEPHTYDVVKHG